MTNRYKMVEAPGQPHKVTIVDTETNRSILAIEELREAGLVYTTPIFEDREVAGRVLRLLNADQPPDIEEERTPRQIANERAEPLTAMGLRHFRALLKNGQQQWGPLVIEQLLDHIDYLYAELPEDWEGWQRA